MATRSAEIAANTLVDLTAVLELEADQSYLIECTGEVTDAINFALGIDPELVGGLPATAGRGHTLFASEPGRLIRQDSAVWYARYYNIAGGSSTITATEATIDD